MAEASHEPLLLTGARLIDPASGRDENGGILILDGRIADLGPHVDAGSAPAGTNIIDCSGLVVAPGLIDMRAFIGEPGAEHRETIRSASEAAAAGGVTTIISMPDTTPATDDPAVVDFLMRRARDTSLVHVYPAARSPRGWPGRR